MSPLLGRDREIERLAEAVAEVAEGRGAGLLLVGAAGSGKTALLDYLAETAEDHGLTVRRARARPVAIERPLDALSGVLGLSDAPRSSRPVLPDGAVGGSAIHSLAETAVDAVEQLATTGPVALLVDDVHYADAATVLAIEALSRRADIPLLLAAASRPPGMAFDAVSRLDIGSLDPATVLAVAAAHLGAPPSGDIQAALGEAQGNPLLVEDILVSAGRPIASRVEALDERAIQLAQAMYVLGDGCLVEELAKVVGSSTAAIDASVDDLVAARLARRLDRGAVGFRHDVYRSAILETFDDVLMRRWHRRAGELRAAQPARRLDALEHVAMGAEAGSRVAADALRIAASEAVETAPRAALSLLDRARGLGFDEPPGDTVTRIRAVGAAGEMSAAEDLCRALLRQPLPVAVERDALHELAFACFTQNRPAEAVTAMDALSSLATEPLDRARAAAQSSFAAAVALDFAGAQDRSESALAASDDPVTEAIAKSVQCLLATFSDRLPAARELGNAAVARAEGDAADEARRYQPWFCAALAHMESDYLDEALGLISTGRQVARLTGSVWSIAGYDALEAFTLSRKGELDDAAAAALGVLPCIGRTDGLRVGAWAYGALARVALHRGDLPAARAFCEAGQALLDSGEVMLGRDQVALAFGRLLEAEGDFSAARDVLRAAWDLFGLLGVDRARHELGIDLLRVSLSLGDRDFAASVAQELAAAAARVTSATARLEAARARLLLEPNVAHALEVVDLAEACPRRLVGAAGLADAGRVLVECGHADAHDVLVEAARQFAERGADADLALVAPLLPVGATRRRPRAGWEALTDTERAVLALVAEGLPNSAIADRLGISRRTVESHVSASYRKLGVRTRVDLARAVLAHQAG